MKTERIGILFDEEYSRKLWDICNYMGKTPHPFFIDAIDRMWNLYTELIEDAR